MKKMTIADAAEYFKVSKEAIHNRIRRGSLDCIVDNGVKYVAVESAKSNRALDDVSDNRYTQYIEKENERLREKVDVLEKETTRLRDQREQMLIDERVKVEQIYKERDAQLRSVLHVVATKFLSHVNTDIVMQEGMNDVINADVVSSDIEEWISLKSFLKLKRVKDKEKKQIKRGFETAFKNGDERLSQREDKIFLNPSKYDYADLLE
jgi:hypothetical protein